jgi:hypothetical protein
VQRVLRKLAHAQYMSIEHRFRRDRARTSNGYRLAVSSPPANCHRLPGACDTGPVTTVPGGRWQPSHRGGGDAAGVTTTYPCIDSVQQPVPANATVGLPRHAGEESSSSRVLYFPSGTSATQQRALAKQFAGVTRDDAQQILDELAGRMDSSRVRDPVRYCARLVERFRRGEFHLELGKVVARQRQGETPGQVTARAKPVTTHDGDYAIDRLPPRIRDALERMRPVSTSDRKDVESNAHEVR